MSTHLLMPWFLPLALGTLGLGVWSSRALRLEGPRGCREARLLVILMAVPLVVWCLAQMGELPT